MILLLIRHADAEAHAATDYDRVLTEKGRKQSEKLGRFLKSAGFNAPDAILTSPYRRAVETASLISQSMEDPGQITEEPALASGMDEEDACKILSQYEDDDTVFMVGHAPDLAYLASYLLGMRSRGAFEMKKASCAVLDLYSPTQGKAVLKALLPVKMVKA